MIIATRQDLEIMCNNCFNLIKSSEAASCTGDPPSCPVACRNGSGDAPGEKPTGYALTDLKLKKLRVALEARLQDSSSKVNVMRHLTQLRYHIDTAMKWIPGCSEIGALSDHTVQQVKQLTATSRVLAPAVYIFSKRIENVVVQKERELRKAMVQTSPSKYNAGNDGGIVLDIERDICSESVADVSSIVSELDSDCGTQYAETLVTQDGPGSTDVGNVNDANEYLSLKNEDEQRRWFYSQCLTVKLSCSDKTKARKTLISDLYAKVKEEGIPIEGWVQWIHGQLMPEETPLGSAASTPAPGAYGGGRDDLERTAPVANMRHSMQPQSLQNRLGGVGGSSALDQTAPVRTLRPAPMQGSSFSPQGSTFSPAMRASSTTSLPQQATYVRRS
jgi:hypothetical protein